MTENILVTGGAGYIGSFIVRELKREGYNPVIFDDFSSGHRDVTNGFETVTGDLTTDVKILDETFAKYRFAGVMHMAAFIQMGESFKDPGKYFRNNLLSSINLFNAMVTHGVTSVVFSSSAGVYGSPKSLPIKEDDSKNPENPYGETKLMIERMLGWYDKAHGIKSVSIRYFNAAGAALDGSLGEDHPEESHLIPSIIKSAIAKKKFILFGGDYKTKDGTCVRDYVHVVDLSVAHTLSLKYLFDGGVTESFNAGIGWGYSNLEVINEIEHNIGKLDYEIGPRRLGDADELCASVEKIKKTLGWEPKYGLKEIIRSAVSWHERHPVGFKLSNLGV